ncbi:MAG: hypothetical protein IIT46_09715, partial [Lachnospiraceae bacterium]|nr:hypothetical protein [Lachnospiraceae bacterium]
TWANATAMTRDNSLSGYWYSAKITLPQGQTAYALVKNSNGQQRPEAQSQGYAVSGNTWVDLYGSVSSSKPSVVPTEVPATPTPAPATPLPEHCGTESELANWDYKKIEAKKGNTIVLNSYDGSSTSITVRAKYCINGTIYNTDFRSTNNYTPGGANDSSELPTFYDNPVLETVTIDGEIDATSGVWLFGKCSHLRSVKGLSNIHTEDCSYMFRECKALFCIDGIPTGAERCTEMFMYTDFSLSGLNITIPNTVTECEKMFSVSKISKISGYIGSNVNNAESMFMNCYNLTDSSGFEVHAKDCSFMFYRCLKMRTRPILGSEITKDESMFDQCA